MLQYRENEEMSTVAVCDDILHFHVGLPKTGTSLLQSRFFPEHNQIEYLGKVLPGNGFPDSRVESLVHDMLRQGVYKCDVELNRRRFNEVVRPLMGKGRAVLMSFEDGTHGSPKRRAAKLANIKAVCGDCRLLITLRQPLDFIESLYLQRVKKHNTLRDHWLKNLKTLNIEQWLDKCWETGEKAELSHLNYGDFISDWEMTFGAENVCILLYEQLKETPGFFLDQICSYLGIELVHDKGVVEGELVNPRISSAQVEAILAAESSLIRTLLYRLAGRKPRELKVNTSEGQGARASVPQQWADRICQLTKPSHQDLVQRLGLPLSEYGYPV